MKSKQNKNEIYLSKLYKKSKQCDCESLVRLSYLAKKRKELETLCDDLSEFLENIHKGNDEVKNLYEKKIYERIGFYNEYNLELNLLVKNEKLKLYYHNEKNNYKKQRVSSEKGIKLLNKNKIITAHCSDCNQLIAPLLKK
ncbi:hypothetical protein HYS72_00565 [Candidatus Pacearchaeota archaeon]|nr:hypothetical protein [Candidatus Pacearchaeota archaeon]